MGLNMNPLGGMFEQPEEKRTFGQKARNALRGFGAGLAGFGAEFNAMQREDRKQLDDERKKAMAQDAMSVYSMINANKIEDAINFVDNRVKYISELGGDPSDTLEIRQMLTTPGRLDEARQELGSFVTAAMQNGYLPQEELLKTDGGQAIFKDPRGGVTARPIVGYDQSLGASGAPADVQSFEAMVSAGNLTPDQRAQAAQVKLGIAPRAAGGGQQIRMIRGADGIERPAKFSQQTGALEIFDGSGWVQAGEQDQSQGVAQMLQLGESYPIPEGVPEQAATVTPRSAVSANGLFIGRSPEDQARLTAEATPPAGFRFNDQGELIPVTGGPAERDLIAGERAKEKRQATLRQRGRTVLRDVQRALEKADTAGPYAGPMAEVQATDSLPRRWLAAQSPAFELNQHLDSIKSNISIDQIQQIRESSPTGGALGQIPVQQQVFMMQVLGSLNSSINNPEVLKENLRDIYNIYLDAMYGDPQEIASAVADGRMTPDEADQLVAEREETAFDLFGRRSDGQQPTAKQDDQGRYIVESDEDYESIPSGEMFIAPDGSVRRKP